MSTNVGQASGVTSSSAATKSSPKISLFAAKSGFLIPKNKLSGSLVPIFRGGKKLGAGNDVVSEEESTKQQVQQRKTKWGPDLTQDTSVRKGRALAYQTRVDQIAQQLKSGILGIGDNRGSSLPSQNLNRESSGSQINSENSELLELERREAIGEILKLNPSYKAPADYKPLLKEAEVPAPIKEYPGNNVIGLIFGPASDTQKRLEKETGAKLRVYGIKADTREKVEITLSNANDDRSVYEQCFVHVSADTYEKVDAAVALVELLVNPVPVNPVPVSTTSTAVSGDDVNATPLSQDITAPYTIPAGVVNQGVAQPVLMSGYVLQQAHFQPYPSAWFPTGPPSGFITPQSSSPMLRNPVPVSASHFTQPNMPSLFGPRPVLGTGFASAPQKPSFVPSRPQPMLPGLQWPHLPQAPSLAYTGSPSGQTNISGPPPFTGNFPTPTGPPSQTMRPLLSSFPQSPSQLTFFDCPLTPGSSSGWSQAPLGPPSALDPRSNAVQMSAQLMVPSQGSHLVSSQPIVSGVLPINAIGGNMVPPVTLPFQSSALPNHPTAAAAFTSAPQPHLGLLPAASQLLPASAPTPIQSSNIASPQQMVGRAAVPNPVLGSTPTPSPGASTLALPPPPQSGILCSMSGVARSFTSIKPHFLTTPKPQHPSSNDFTFLQHRPQNPASPVITRSVGQPTQTNMPPQNLTMRQPQAPSFQPGMHSTAPPPLMQGFMRPQDNNRMGQPRAQISMPSPHGLPRHPAFHNPGPRPPSSPIPHMGPRNFNPDPRLVNVPGPFSPRLGNPLPVQQYYQPAATRPPQGPLAPSNQMNSNLPFPSGKAASSSSGVQQKYDPFSPTSVSLMPQSGGNPAKLKKQESDPEYEDLMASVGVK